MKTISTLALAVLLANALTACTSSKPERRGPPPNMQSGLVLKPAGLLFASFDTDQSYSVSQTELSSGLDRAFDRADDDGSGQLSLIEYQDWAAMALGAPSATPGWMQLDRDGTKSIDPIEFRSRFERIAQSYGLFDGGGIQLADLTSDIRDMRNAARSSSNRSTGPRGSGRPSRIGTSEDEMVTAEH